MIELENKILLGLDADLSINGNRQSGVRVSVRPEAFAKVFKTDHVGFAYVNDRLYLGDNSDGYKIYQAKDGNCLYHFAASWRDYFRHFIGRSDFKYDDKNEMYYIERTDK